MVSVFDGESPGNRTSGRPMTRAGVVIVAAALVLGGAIMLARALTGSASTAGGAGRAVAPGSASATPGSTGGAVLTVVPATRPRAVLRGLDRIEGGLGRAYPPLPEGRIRRRVVQMENTRAHDVYAHFCTISFVEGRFAVVVEAYGLSGPVGRRRAVRYARAQRDLLAARG
jgi:hypothetical protein